MFRVLVRITKNLGQWGVLTPIFPPWLRPCNQQTIYTVLYNIKNSIQSFISTYKMCIIAIKPTCCISVSTKNKFQIYIMYISQYHILKIKSYVKSKPSSTHPNDIDWQHTVTLFTLNKFHIYLKLTELTKYYIYTDVRSCGSIFKLRQLTSLTV